MTGTCLRSAAAAIGGLILIAQAPDTLAAAPRAASAPFDPVAFFSGATEGTGRLKKLMSLAQQVHVIGHGVARRDGSLVLDQTVTIPGEAARSRHWQLHQSQPGLFVGTLSDAEGPVVARVAGAHLLIHYTAMGNIDVDQNLTLEPGGSGAQNVTKFRKFGVAVATLNEFIRKIGA